eukprot:GILJ01007929.1.p1 GENE.GILJ01007929.1~~GILJ01007929.1.p1  ORF type:complete len:577 (-),score=76.52 GILJ01007929.1:163-1893(-)
MFRFLRVSFSSCRWRHARKQFSATPLCIFRPRQQRVCVQSTPSFHSNVANKCLSTMANRSAGTFSAEICRMAQQVSNRRLSIDLPPTEDFVSQPTFLQLVDDAVTSARDMSVQELCDFVWAAGRLRLPVANVLLDVVESKQLTADLVSLPQACQLICGFKLLKVQNASLIRNLWQIVLPRLTRADITDLALLLESICLSSSAQEDVVWPVLNEVSNRFVHSDLELNDATAILEACSRHWEAPRPIGELVMRILERVKHRLDEDLMVRVLPHLKNVPLQPRTFHNLLRSIANHPSPHSSRSLHAVWILVGRLRSPVLDQQLFDDLVETVLSTKDELLMDTLAFILFTICKFPQFFSPRLRVLVEAIDARLSQPSVAEQTSFEALGFLAVSFAVMEVPESLLTRLLSVLDARLDEQTLPVKPLTYVLQALCIANDKNRDIRRKVCQRIEATVDQFSARDVTRVLEALRSTQSIDAFTILVLSDSLFGRALETLAHADLHMLGVHIAFLTEKKIRNPKIWNPILRRVVTESTATHRIQFSAMPKVRTLLLNARLLFPDVFRNASSELLDLLKPTGNASC